MKREYKIALSQEYYSDVVYLSQYDTDYDIEFTVLDKYAKATGIDGYTAKFTGTRCDGLGFTFESTASDETVSFEINTSLTAISGTHKGEIVFYDTNGLFFGSANVQIVVEPAARPDGTIDADVERAQEIADQIQDIVDTAAEETTAEARQIVADLEADVTGVKEDLSEYEGIFTADVDESVQNWLDAHPEATTTVEDGAITWAKLNDSVQEKIDGKAPAIVEAKTAYENDVTESFISASLLGPSEHTTSLFDTEDIIFPNAKKYMPSSSAIETVEYVSPNTLHFDGATASSDVWYGLSTTGVLNEIVLQDHLPSGSKLSFRMYLTGSIDGSRPYSNIKVNDSVVKYNLYFDPSTNMAAFDYTANADVTKISIRTKIIANSRLSDVYISYACYVNGRELLIPPFSDNSYAINASDILGWSKVCSIPLQNQIRSVADTKKYIDEHAPEDYVKQSEIVDFVKRQELVYVTPEIFGAKGDGVADDTSAIKACFMYAIENNLNVYGGGTYRVTEQIELVCDDMNIVIHVLKAYSNHVAEGLLKLKGENNTLIFTKLNGGLKLCSDSAITTKNNLIKINNLQASGHSLIVQKDDGVENPKYTSYNRFYINFINSWNSDCILVDYTCTENSVHDASFQCLNGWAFRSNNGGSMDFRGCSFESNVLNGMYIHRGSVALTDCRTSELVGKMADRLIGIDKSGGVLFKIVDYGGARLEVPDSYIPYASVDLTDCWPIGDSRFNDLATTDRPWEPILRNVAAATPSKICTNIKYGSYSNKFGAFILGSEMMVVGNKKICTPAYSSCYTITESDFDMRDPTTNADNKPYPTKFVIDAEDCVIHLPSSYCCIGYSKFVVEQNDLTKLCTIYKESDTTTPIFDGSMLGVGVYELTAECDLDKADKVFVDFGRPEIRMYTGNNDIWTVRKIS